MSGLDECIRGALRRLGSKAAIETLTQSNKVLGPIESLLESRTNAHSLKPVCLFVKRISAFTPSPQQAWLPELAQLGRFP